MIPMLAKKYGMSLEQAKAADSRVASAAHDRGLEYILGAHDVGNTLDMHRLIHFAAEKGKQKELGSGAVAVCGDLGRRAATARDHLSSRIQ